LPPASFSIEPLPPFRLDLTVWVLRRRPRNGMDLWDGRVYRRILILDGAPLEVAVEQSGSAESPQLHITVSGSPDLSRIAPAATPALERLLGLSVDLAEFYRFAADDPALAPLAQRFRGFKPSRFPGLFETLVNGIACQQVTLSLGILLLNRLAEHFGPAATGGGAHAFPQPEHLAGRNPEDLRPLGFSRQKAQAIIELAEGVAAGRVDLSGLEALNDGEAVERLSRLRGIGRWTAEYALLRGLGRLHVFPGDDVGGRRNLQRWLGLPEPLDYAGVHRTLERWQPYAGLVYFHLLLKRLAESGYLT
jgi:DNA-3-methyladenine glycosylase II